ncbi:MAG: nucleotidyltransferase family protein [Promethearchaeota archaeon]
MKKASSAKIDLERIFKTIRPHMEEIINKFNVDIIGIIGSYLRREQKGEGDLGFFIKFKIPTIKPEISKQLNEFLEDVFDCKIDLIIEHQIDEKLKYKIIKDVEFIEG